MKATVKVLVVVNGDNWEGREDEVIGLSKGGGKNVFFCPWRESLGPEQKLEVHEKAVETEGRKRKREGSDQGQVAGKKTRRAGAEA